ncbi:MAG: hypothetical protein V4717_17395 [Bacteroidota bacterium]
MSSNLIIKACKKSLLLTGVGLMLFAQVELFAAKGDIKLKKGVVLKFKGFDLKTTTNSFFSLKPGVVYKGSFNNVEKAPQQTTLQSIITFQQGNTTFILPYKHKVLLPRFKTPEAPKF